MNAIPTILGSCRPLTRVVKRLGAVDTLFRREDKIDAQTPIDQMGATLIVYVYVDT
jgi:hypothetical protein